MRKLTAFLIGLLFGGILISEGNAMSAQSNENLEISVKVNEIFAGELEKNEDSDGVEFFLTTQPKKGKVQLAPDGTFLYKPSEGKKGRDYFGYRSKDEHGNSSQEGTVIIKIIYDDKERNAQRSRA